MIITDTACIKNFIRLCTDGWEQGWHERNGGNLTYRMTDEDILQCRPYFNEKREWISMGFSDKDLSGSYFTATGSGKYFRNMAINPAGNLGIVEINSDGSAWRVVWGLENGAKPTSELPTHLMNHAVRLRATNGKNRVIYHAHTPGIIALTYVLPLTAKNFSRILWQSATECAVVFPKGVGVVPWHVPGGTEIALVTSKVMETFSAAVWAHHGLFCSGADFDETFGLMHTIEKAADIYIRVLSTGMPVKQTITDEDLLAIAKEFNVKLNDDFLDISKP